ncbi:MAG: 2Fe-2S iron-sulfur cluster binding domain-containing protein [Alphaproteobacteria bacterium]|nr:2Fe-2S iron-sulfur cluster binding domain-containing protein [Alphaproteobacteria bacterium]
MPEVVFIYPDGTSRAVQADLHFSLMQVAQRAGIPGIEGVCGGSMACATCHVLIHPDWAARIGRNNEKTEEEIDTLELASGTGVHSRLSCQIEITPDLDGLIVLLPACAPRAP